jgi:phenylalanyl-tRNA synthetase alpha chain
MENIILVKQQFEQEIAQATTFEQVEALRIKFLGKKGLITALMPLIKQVPNEQKRDFGMQINQLKTLVEQTLESLAEKFEQEKIAKQISSEKQIDITLPTSFESGSLHPRTTLAKEIVDIFVSMGFCVEDGNEIETEYNNFDAVNVPKNHPARDMQDTFWLSNGQLLKTHTSALQNKMIRKYNGPFKAIFPGRCFRNEAVDNSHENTFFQLEGMLVDKDVSISNLIYFMKTMLSELFKKDINIRMRPGFFPFVEPGFEMDAACTFCNGTGCKVCKNSGWIELCPCGMIHPNVLSMGGLDPNEYSGFAFGLGFDRLVMLQTGFDDIRHLNSGNLKVLKQFKTKG